jgi:peptide/nickel transport system substrate-binding protein
MVWITKKLTLSLGLIALAALALAAGSSATQKADATTLRMAAAATGPFIQTFNPLLGTSNANTGRSKLLIYEPLMLPKADKSGGSPWLATSSTWAAAGRTLTINLRRGVKWSDGQAFTSADVKFTFDLLTKYAALNLDGLPIVSTSAPSAYKAVVKFSSPAYHLRWWTIAPVPAHVWRSVSDPVTYTDANPVGTGPFMLKSFTTQAITLTRNPLYWGTKSKLDTIQYLSFDSETTMLAALQAGDIDWITTSVGNPSGIAKQAGGKIGYLAYQTPNLIFLVPNNASGPTSDKAVRLAISRAIDRRTVAVQSFYDRNPPEFSPTGLNTKFRLGYVAKPYKKLRVSYDPTGAKKILTDAGYKLGSNGVFSSPDGKPLSLTITLPNTDPSGDWVTAGKLIAQELTALGIPTSIKAESTSALKNDIQLGNFQLTMRKYGGSPVIFDVFTDIFAQGSDLMAIGQKAASNYERYTNPQAGPLLAAWANSAPGSKAQANASAGLQRLMVSDQPIIPLWRVSALGMWRTDRFSGWPSVKNPYASPQGSDDSAMLVPLRLVPVK